MNEEIALKECLSGLHSFQVIEMDELEILKKQ